MRRAYAVAALSALGYLAAGPAHAVVPGGNGRIAFDSDRGGSADVYTIRADGSDLQRLTNATGSEPVWSPDGGRLAFFSFRDGDGEIYSMSADGSGQTRLTQMPGVDANPTWSPDGAKLAFQSSFPASHIYAMNADGSDLRQITTGVPVNFQPDWSSDGRRIVFSTARDGGLPIYTMNPDGTDQRLLTRGAPDAVDQDPVWSPDGTKVAFARSGDIWVVGADGSGERNLTPDSATDGEPCWSPDGTLIGFSSDRGGSTDVYSMRTEGSGVTRLTSDPATDTHCEWQTVRLATGGRLRLRVTPRRIVSGRRTRFRFRVTAGARAVSGAPVRFAGRTATTDARGRARLTVRFGQAGVRAARATKGGFRSGRAFVRVAGAETST